MVDGAVPDRVKFTKAVGVGKRRMRKIGDLLSGKLDSEWEVLNDMIEYL